MKAKSWVMRNFHHPTLRPGLHLLSCRRGVPENVVQYLIWQISKASWPRGPGFDFTPEGWCLSLDTQWNNGMVEKWNNGYEKWSAAGGLISDRDHSCKNRSQSAKPSIPTFQYSSNPRLLILAETFDSDLARLPARRAYSSERGRTRVSITD